MARTSAAVPIIVAIALFLSVVVAFAAVLAVVSAEEAAQPATDTTSAADAAGAAEPAFEKADKAADADPAKVPEPVELPDDATLLKMKVRELKAILEKKGPDAACLACTSKKEYVDRIRETADWAAVEVKKEDAAGTEDAPSMEELKEMFTKGRDSEQMKKLKENLKAAGIDTSNIFSADGFDSERFAEQFKDWNVKPNADAEAEAEAKEEVKVDL